MAPKSVQMQDATLMKCGMTMIPTDQKQDAPKLS